MFVCPDVRTYVHISIRSQKVTLISMKFGMLVEVNEWCTTIYNMTWFKVSVTSPSELEFRPFLKPISSPADNRPQILKVICSCRIFYIRTSFCVTWLWSWEKRQFWRVDRQSHMGLIFYFAVTVLCDVSVLLVQYKLLVHSVVQVENMRCWTVGWP